MTRRFFRLCLCIGLLVAAGWPVLVGCTAPQATCVTGLDEQGSYSQAYSYEPFLVVVLEEWLGNDIPLEYYTGTEEHFAGPIQVESAEP